MARLYGEDILLREYRQEDLKHMREWVNDREITDFLSDIFVPPHTQNNTEDFLNYVLNNNGSSEIHFIIADKDTEDYIGQIDILGINWRSRTAVMGIVIGTKGNRGRGYGTKAIKLLQGFVFNKLNLNRLELELRAYNKRAYRCYKKCGFIEEGRKRKNFFMNGHYTDTILMSILKEEYEAMIGEGK